MESVVIRKAKPGDEQQIARVHIQSWQESYLGLIPQSYLDGLPGEPEERNQVWKRILANQNRWTWVSEISNEVVGFILFGPPRDQDREGYIELGAVYLLADRQGAGIGFSLLSAGFKFMKNLGYKKAYCWVLEKNPTIRFYEKTGAIYCGQTKVDEIAGQKFSELAYEWSSIDFFPSP